MKGLGIEDSCIVEFHSIFFYNTNRFRTNKKIGVLDDKCSYIQGFTNLLKYGSQQKIPVKNIPSQLLSSLIFKKHIAFCELIEKNNKCSFKLLVT